PDPRRSLPDVQTSVLRCVAYSPDGTLLAGGNGQTAELWDPRTRQVIARLGTQVADRYTCGLAFSAGGGILATGDPGRAVRLWNVSGYYPGRPAGAVARAG